MIALYMRLSIADEDTVSGHKDESNSIENQRAILMDYIKRTGWSDEEIYEYIDDGFSGTNFERPGFKKMIHDMKHGKIRVLLTKDLSRLGRNYVEVGDYMEQIFPMLGIRYIAVNSHYDSDRFIGKTSGIDMGLMNLVNSFYSKDLSKKYKSAVKTKWKNGKSTSGRPTFGYIKDPIEKGEWIIDPEAAEIVRYIFDLALEGKKTKEIVNILNAKKVITPGQYREEHRHVNIKSRKVTDEEWIWDSGKVWKILKSYEYTGALVHSKEQLIKVGSKNSRTVPEDERFVFENHHEPIVTHYEFNKAQSIIRSFKKGPVVNRDDYPLAGKIYCGNCGLKMTHPINKASSYVLCRHKEIAGDYSKCEKSRYDTETIDRIVIEQLRHQINQLDLELKEHKLRFPDNRKILKEKAERLKTLQVEKINLYENYAMGHIDKETYIKRREKIIDQITRIKADKRKAESKTGKLEKMQEQLNQMADYVLDICNSNHLTPEIVEVFIEKVVIYDAAHIEIRFTFEDYIKNALELLIEGTDQKDNQDIIAV